MECHRASVLSVGMELTAGQRRVVEHADGPLRVVGGDGHGRTTAIVARYLALVGKHQPSTVLVVCPSRASAGRFRDAVLPHLCGGFDALPITTWFGVAFDLVSRAGKRPRLLSGPEQRSVVTRLLAMEAPDDWPLSSAFLGRDAFVDEVVSALSAYQARPPGSGLPAVAMAGRWPELAGFAQRYVEHLASRGQTDRAGLLAAAAAQAAPDAYDHILIDDHDGHDPGLGPLLAGLSGPTHDVTVVPTGVDDPLPWPTVDVALTHPFRRPAPPALVICRHPSTEAEAVAGELLGARAAGLAWSDMAVLLRRPQSHGRRLARALGRHRIPVAAGPGLAARAHDSAVTAIIDLLRWVAAPDDVTYAERLLASPMAALGADGLVALRDDLVVQAATPTATPAELAFVAWERGLGHLGAGSRRDDAAVDAIVAFLDRLQRQGDDNPAQRLPALLTFVDEGAMAPDTWRVSAAMADHDAVTVTSIAAAAGREWHTVVLPGCVEGELPRISGRAPLFDPDLLDGAHTVASPAERRRRSLAAERRLFARAASRATGRLVATAAPQPGVLLSRFVEGWTEQPAQLPTVAGPAPVRLAPTQGTAEVFPDGRLVLSASQLATYHDCPLRYAYQYGLRVRDAAGVPAALGSLVHEVLAEFLSPDRPADAPPRSRVALLGLATERWTDDIARYRPQVEECRRDYFQMLENWWAAEGDGPGAPGVLAVERRFDVEVGDLRLVGAIDRIDRAADGQGIRIVDYKTGRSEPRADAMPDDLQLAIYHLAATRDPELVALGPPQELRLLYLRSMHTHEQPIVTDHAESTEMRVAAAADDIRAERFEPAVDASCRNCSFHRLCPLQPQGREAGTA